MTATMRPLLLALAAAVALSGCGTLPEDATADAGAPEGGCGPVEQPPLQAGSHLIGDAEPPVPFSSTPPTSGWHSSGALEVTVHGEDDPLTEPEQVSVLEADGVVISYRDLPEDDIAALAAFVEDGYAGRVAVTPYDAIDPGEVALTAWGHLQRCDGLDLDAVRAFVDTHASDEVDPGH
jgi:hypothetical protein